MDPHMKRNSNDVGWEYGVLYDPGNPDKVQCKLCNKRMSGGVFRIKEHIAKKKGNVSACLSANKEDQDKCKNALLEAKNKKTMKRKHEKALRSEVNIDMSLVDDDDIDMSLVDQNGDVGVVPTTQSSKGRELYDDDFESEEEDEVMVDLDFDFDESEPYVFPETPLV